MKRTVRVDTEPAATATEVATPIPARKGFDSAPTFEHVMRPTCWCRPTVNYEDLISGDRVYVHKAAIA